MYRLTKEEYISNLEEVFNFKFKKYKALGEELKALQTKINKLKETPTGDPKSESKTTKPGSKDSTNIKRMKIS